MKWPRASLCCLAGLFMVGCPYDRLYSPRLENATGALVGMQVVLANGTIIDDGGALAPGDAVVWGYPPEQIARITLSVDGEVVEDLDAERIAVMLKCTANPRDVTWYIEADGVRPSRPCRQ